MLAAAAAAADPPLPVASAPEAPPTWSLGRRIAFRFVFAYAAAWLWPFPLGSLPLTGWADRAWQNVWRPLVVGVGNALLHPAQPLQPADNGSGDSTYAYVELATTLLVALLATSLWSLADRRRRHYARLHDWLRTWVRWMLAWFMFSYGFAKVFQTQFPAPSAVKLEQPYGDASPMGLLWTFMGASTPYNVFTGFAEVLGGALMVFRRTTTLGALVIIGVMANVVALNLCYDVPVKIFSTELLLSAVFLTAPRLGRLYQALVRERAVPAVAARPLFARPRLDLVARVCGLVFAGWAVYHMASEAWHTRAARAAPPPPLAGNWVVESFTRDHVAATDPTRWQRVGMDVYKESGRFIYVQADLFYDRYGLTDDPRQHELTLASPSGAGKWRIRYRLVDGDHLLLDGELAGHAIEVKLRRIPPRPYRLIERGFHWINEQPYNR